MGGDSGIEEESRTTKAKLKGGEMKSSISLMLIYFALIACQPEEIVGPPGASGRDGRDGIDGLPGEVGEPGQDSIAELINPCGASSSIDEVLIRLNDGRLLAYFEHQGRRFLAELPAGEYTSTDHERCRFTVDAMGNVTDELGNYWSAL